MEQLYILVREKAKEKQLSGHRVATEMLAGIIRGSKYWSLEMVSERWKRLFLNKPRLVEWTLGQTHTFSH